jgi:uncharacterized protein Yka (UPF0111/DUF47 family)
LSETISLIEDLQNLAGNVAYTSTVLVTLCKALEADDAQVQIENLVRAITKSEEKTDSVFEVVAEKIMSVEFLNINPDYLLDVAKYIDEISDLLERAALHFQYLGKFSDQGVIELLVDAATQVQKIASQIVDCLKILGAGNASVRGVCDILSEREKAVDALREEFNSLMVSVTLDQKIWLKDIFGNFDQIADIGRDLSILFRVIGIKLDKQRTLTIKQTRN